MHYPVIHQDIIYRNHLLEYIGNIQKKHILCFLQVHFFPFDYIIKYIFIYTQGGTFKVLNNTLDLEPKLKKYPVL